MKYVWIRTQLLIMSFFSLSKRVEGHAEKEVHSYKGDDFVTKGKRGEASLVTMAKLWESLTHSHNSGSVCTADCVITVSVYSV